MNVSIMSSVSIQKGTAADKPIIRNFLQLMVEEMASMGGYAVTRNEASWTQIEQQIQDLINRTDHRFLLAFPSAQATSPIGFAQAHVDSLESIFEPRRRLHISAIYVAKTYRRKGIGKALLFALLDWGQKRGCTEAELNTLVGNPARLLYQQAGFTELEIKMTRQL